MQITHKYKIRIGFPLSLSGGGPSLFIQRLRKSIDSQRLAKVSRFINPLTDINIFANVARNVWGKLYIFRVDGMYFDSALSKETKDLKNKPIFEGITKSAGVVFQASFGYNLISHFYGKIDRPFEIINNGVDINFFSPHGPHKRKELGIDDKDLVFVTSAKWRSHKRLIDIINVFIEFDKNINRTCHLLILGADSTVEGVNHPRIRNIGFVQPNTLPGWYRTGNIFLFFSWLDNCPNSVIEGVACGLPVVCTNQGGTRELIEMTRGGIVAEADEEFTFQPVELYKPPRPDHNVLLKAMLEIADNYESYVTRIDRSKIDINSVAVRYVQFINDILIDRGGKS